MPRAERGVLGGAAGALAGVVLGGMLAVAAVPVALAVLVLLVCSRQEAAARGLTRVVELDRRRLRRFLGHDAGPPAAAPRRLAGYLALRVALGPAALVLVAAGLALGLGYGVGTLVLTATVGLPASSALGGLGIGVVALYLTGQVVAGAAALDRRLAARVLGDDPERALRRRVDALRASRADVVAAVDDERRRIERDLHDGVQQRVVALAMLLGRARRDPERATDLTRQAHDDAQALLGELREITWRVFPAVLDEAGLHAAVETLAERCPLPVSVHCDLRGEPPPAVAVAAYFVVSEAVANAVKHAGATRLEVGVSGAGGDDGLRVRVRDDGGGGADPTGGGLAGLARRVRGLDGTMVIESPPGGPTTVSAELPCA